MHILFFLTAFLLSGLVVSAEAKTKLTVLYTGNTDGQLESCD